MAEDTCPPCSCTGFALSESKNGSTQLEQHVYLRKLEQMPLDASFLHFKSMRIKLAWLSHTRPDCMFEIYQLVQVTEAKFKEG